MNTPIKTTAKKSQWKLCSFIITEDVLDM